MSPPMKVPILLEERREAFLIRRGLLGPMAAEALAGREREHGVESAHSSTASAAAVVTQGIDDALAGECPGAPRG